MGLPKGSIIRPSILLLMGIPAVRPVRTTRCPSTISEASPNNTTPVVPLVLMSCAMPFTPHSNKTISPYSTSFNPAMTAMPSPTVRTSPTCWKPRFNLKSLISSFIREMIFWIFFSFGSFCMDRLSCLIRPSVVQS